MSIITQEQYNASNQSVQIRHIKVDLLNKNYQIIDDLSKYTLDVSVSMDADNDSRRSGNITLINTDNKFKIESGGEIWLNRYIQIYSGTEDLITGNVIWTNMGIYLINTTSQTYDVVTNNIILELADIMTELTGERDGVISDLPTVITAGSNIRNAMMATLGLVGINKYLIENNPQTVPEDILIERGGSIYDILKALRDISADYEMFFDDDGVFVYQKIPTTNNDPIVLDSDYINNLNIDFNINVDFTNVKNKITVLGRELNPNYFGGTATVSSTSLNDYYNISISGITTMENIQDGTLIGFVAPYRVEKPVLLINGTASGYISTETSLYADLYNTSDTYYIVMKKGLVFLFMGRKQIEWTVQDDDDRSPFSINKIGTIEAVFQDGEYDNILTDDLARQRADYELYLHARIQDSIDITCLNIPFLRVNTKIEFKNDDLEVNGIYIIKSISYNGFDENGTMNINAMRFYESLP